MLEMREACESCQRGLSPASTDAFICSYECTFCRQCASTRLEFVCPNCGGDLVQRPTRAAADE